MTNRAKLISAVARLKKRGQYLADNAGSDKQIQFYQQILDDITDYYNSTEIYIHQVQQDQMDMAGTIHQLQDQITRLEAIMLIHGFSEPEINNWLNWSTPELQSQVKQCYQDRFFFAPCIHRTNN